MKFKGRYWLIFDQKSSHRPIIHDMSKAHPNVVFNIRQSSVSNEMGIIAVELEGEREEVKSAICWFEQNGVKVDPVEIQTIEG